MLEFHDESGYAVKKVIEFGMIKEDLE